MSACRGGVGPAFAKVAREARVVKKIPASLDMLLPLGVEANLALRISLCPGRVPGVKKRVDARREEGHNRSSRSG